MQAQRNQPVSGHAFVIERASGPRFYVKWRDENGQHQRCLGPAWVELREHEWRNRRGRAPLGQLRWGDARAQLRRLLAEAEEGRASRARTGITFADAAREWLRHGERERGLKQSTIRNYRYAVERHLIPAFGTRRVEDVSARDIASWRAEWLERTGHYRQAGALLTMLHGIFTRAARVHGLTTNPAAEVERVPVRYDATDYDFYSPEEVWSLVRAAASDQDGAMYLTAAFAGLRRGELLALRWRDVDFDQSALRVNGNVSYGEVVRPKSGHGRAVPMVPEVAQRLARLGQSGQLVGPDDPVFPGLTGYLDGSALRRRYTAALKRAGLRRLRFHDLRHTFGSLAINRASIVQVQAWMGHAHVSTTMRYLHHKSRADEAELLAGAFAVEPVAV